MGQIARSLQPRQQLRHGPDSLPVPALVALDGCRPGDLDCGGAPAGPPPVMPARTPGHSEILAGFAVGLQTVGLCSEPPAQARTAPTPGLHLAWAGLGHPHAAVPAGPTLAADGEPCPKEGPSTPRRSAGPASGPRRGASEWSTPGWAVFV